MGEDKLTGKRSLHALLWEWKGKLVKLKAEVDRALTSVLEGLESCGPGFKPKAAGHKKKWKKHWAHKKFPKPNRNSTRPEARKFLRSEMPVVLPVVGLVPATGTGGSSPARPEKAGGSFLSCQLLFLVSLF